MSCALLLASCGVVTVQFPPAGGPGADPGPAPGSGSESLTRPGVFHRPEPGRPVERVVFPVPPGEYRSISLGVTVTHGGWAAANPGGTHNIFWLARDRNRDLFGYANIRGRRELFVRYGIGTRQPQKAKISTRANFIPGETYRFEYIYDAAGGRVELTVRRGSQQVARLRGVPDRRVVRVRQGQRFLIDFGFTGRDNPNEPASYGWVFRDLRVEVR